MVAAWWRPVAAAGVAVGACWSASLATHWDAAGRVMHPAIAQSIAADAFLMEAAVITLAAPLAGTAITSRRASALTASLAFVLLSLLLSAAASRVSGYPASLVGVSHVALAVVATTLAAFGAAVRSSVRNALDAAGLALVVTVTLASALLVGGPLTADLSERAINAGLLASPTIAITSAAQIDLLRSDTFYQLAPISHRRFTYPEWQTTTIVYGGVGVLFAALTRKGLRA